MPGAQKSAVEQHSKLKIISELILVHCVLNHKDQSPFNMSIQAPWDTSYEQVYTVTVITNKANTKL